MATPVVAAADSVTPEHAAAHSATSKHTAPDPLTVGLANGNWGGVDRSDGEEEEEAGAAEKEYMRKTRGGWGESTSR